MSVSFVEVVAGVLIDDQGQFFLASRPEGKPYAGYWEFPGGKIEAGETAFVALKRELEEELGIEVTAATPWLCKVFAYEHATVRLQFLRVQHWLGDPQPREGQQFSWHAPGAALSVEPVLPANGPILKALTLPTDYAITCAADYGIEAILAALPARLAAGLSMLQVREPHMSLTELEDFVFRIAAMTQGSACRVVVNADPMAIQGWPVDGVHLNVARLRALTSRPNFAWVGASIHSPEELALAEKWGVDYALLGPIKPTPTHPEAQGIGWTAFQSMLGLGAPMPVYGLGGLQHADLDDAIQHGAQGIARMREVWR